MLQRQFVLIVLQAEEEVCLCSKWYLNSSTFVYYPDNRKLDILILTRLIIFLVPTCSGTIMMMLMMGMSQDPDLADCVTVLQEGVSDNGQLNQAACDCIIRVTPEKFYSWTGVEPSSCGMGNGLSADEERNMCINGGRLKWP